MIESHPSLNTISNDLRLVRGISAASVFSLVIYVLVAHLAGQELQSQFALTEEQRTVWRTVFYVIAIVTLPLTNLIRHVQLRLNQTMPGEMPARNRYLVTVLVSMALVETLGIYGLIMFILGDDFNTLYILMGMSALGMFLYRPKLEEYTAILQALSKPLKL